MNETERKDKQWELDVMEIEDLLKQFGEVNLLLIMKTLKVSPDYALDIMEHLQEKLCDKD